MKNVSVHQVDVITGTLDSHFHTSKRAIYCNFVQQSMKIYHSNQ